jgi:hypothetical protein
MMTPNIDKPSDDTLEKIDFVIQGLENGQFEELAKKVDFHQKLKGEDSKRFIKTLLEVIDAQAFELNSLRSDLGSTQTKNADLENRVIDLETMLQDYIKNMRGIANGLAILADPTPPLSGGLQGGATRYYNEADAEQFISSNKDRY